MRPRNRLFFNQIIFSLLTSPFLSTPTKVIFVINLMTGGSSGYRSPVSIVRLYIRFSKFVCQMQIRRQKITKHGKIWKEKKKKKVVTLMGPIIIPFHFFIWISVSFCKPHDTVPSPVPFCPSSSSSNSLKLLGITFFIFKHKKKFIFDWPLLSNEPSRYNSIK